MEKLGISPGQLIAQLVNFIMLFLALKFLAWKPLMKYLDAKKAKIAKINTDSILINDRLVNTEKEKKDILDQARLEALTQSESARMAIQNQVRQQLAEAEKNAEKIRNAAISDAETLKNSSIESAKDRLAELIIEATTRLIGHTLTLPENMPKLTELWTVPVEAMDLGNPITCTTAVELTATEKNLICKQLNTQVEFTVDPSILGGMIFESGQLSVDASVRMKISSLKRALK
jgi:F-type H+-transporting ATPase subunit b